MVSGHAYTDELPRGFLRSCGCHWHQSLYALTFGIQVSIVSLLLSSFMESSRPLGKACPHCDTTLHVKRAVCGCGHTFPSKRKAQCTAKKEVMKRRRILESQREKLARQEQDRVRKERMRMAARQDTHAQKPRRFAHTHALVRVHKEYTRMYMRAHAVQIHSYQLLENMNTQASYVGR